MSDEIKPDETTETAEVEEATESTADGADSGLDPKVKAEMSKLRGEAAGWRTQLREAQDALKAAKSPEDFATAISEFETKLAAKDRELVIARHGLPAELAALLPESGKTAEELEAIATGLKKFVPAVEAEVEPEELGGGLNPGKPGKGATDPASLAKSVRGARPRFR